MSVLIETTIGDLVFDLYTKERPRSCLNFLKLCKMKYYNFCLFHSVRRNFIAQSGDPTGSGRGGESVYAYIYGDQEKYFDLEIKPRIKHRTKGTISFVNNGNNMHGSQFFITLGDGLDFLDGKHTVFGQLAEGFDILEKLNETICDESHKPFQDVRISHTIVLDDPFDDPKGLVIPDRSPEPTKEQLDSGRIAADEDIDDKGKSSEEIRKKLEDKELEIGTKILETVGDIDDADLKPPENVLFVCKLNPVTNSDDLKIIFSRFGKIVSCEIITDHKTGDSLGYGFIEFKEIAACEKAYLKMDNVLIDDRRIHVDFCQSVAKVQWHNSAVYKNALSEKQANRKELALKDKSKKDLEKYSMIFDKDEEARNKTKKLEKGKDEKIRKRKKCDSESETDREDSKKYKRKSVPSRNSRRRSRSSSYSSDEEVSKTTKNKKRRDDENEHISKQQKKRRDSEDNTGSKLSKRYNSEEESNGKRKKRIDNDQDSKTINRKQFDQSGYSSDQETKPKADKKAKKAADKLSMKNVEKKSKKSESSSDSESDHERRKSIKVKNKSKRSTYSDSDSESEDENNAKAKPKSKTKSVTKSRDKKRCSSSEDDYKEKPKSRKSTDSKLGRNMDESDTEEYAEYSPKQKKRKKDSSDESSEDERPRKNRSRERKHSSTPEGRRKSSVKKTSSTKKQLRRREDSDYSDSSR